MARTRLSPEEQKLLIERQKEERLRRLQERNQVGLLNPRARRANPEVANTNLLDSSVTNVNANMTPIPTGLLQRGVQGANNPYTPSYNQSNIVNDPRLKSAMENVYKPTMRERVGGFFNRANESFQNAAPIFAVAQEFRKAGAPRAVGAPIQGDPYGKMMQIQQGREQAENLAELRQQYPQFANLSDQNFEKVITELAVKGELNRKQSQPSLTPENYKEQFPEVYAGDMVADQAYGAKDRFDAGFSAVSGAIGLPLKTTEKALAATVTYNKEVMEAQKTKYTTRDSVYQMKSVEEMLPKPRMNEYKALQQTYQIRDIFSKAKSDLQAELARGGLTASQEGKIREGIRKFDNIIIRSNNRIDSMEGARGVSMDTTSSTPNWEGSMQEAESTFGVLENVRSS